MAAYIVTYDLMVHGQNYKDLIAVLETYGTHWHMQGSVWVVNSVGTAEQVRDHLAQYLDGNDELFVGLLAPQAAWIGPNLVKNSQWLKSVIV